MVLNVCTVISQCGMSYDFVINVKSLEGLSSHLWRKLIQMVWGGESSVKKRTYLSSRPNFTWHIVVYDKLKPFGFSLHGCVDSFSRRVMWLKVQRSNKNPRAAAKYFLECVEASGGCPTRVYTDPELPAVARRLIILDHELIEMC